MGLAAACLQEEVRDTLRCDYMITCWRCEVGKAVLRLLLLPRGEQIFDFLKLSIQFWYQQLALAERSSNLQ